MAKLYAADPITIWIKTPRDVAKQRIYTDDIRDARNEDFALGASFDHIFEPKGVKEEDVAAFTALLKDFE